MAPLIRPSGTFSHGGEKGSPTENGLPEWQSGVTFSPPWEKVARSAG